MDRNNERRREQRLRYQWPIWFAEDFNGTLSQGQMVDVSSGGAAFTCHVDESCPCLGQDLTARFSVPCFGAEDSFEMANFTRPARVCRIDNVNSFVRRIAVQFAEPLPFKPGEQANTEAGSEQRFGALMI
jgi:hypothetical protein